MSDQALLIAASSFVAGFIWAAFFGWKLGVIGFAFVLLAALSLYFALGLVPGFLGWMKANEGLDVSIVALIWCSLVCVPFFLGTAAKWIIDEVKRTYPTDRR